MKIAIILGTRPEIIKLSSIIRECEKRKLDYFILHTNQHYSENMDKVFFDELELPQPKYDLNIGSGMQAEQTGKMLIEIEKVLSKENPGIVLVQGDTNTVLAGALAASKMGIKVGHVEAGLRSYDRAMPEEINRVLADHISDYLFVPTEEARQNLLKEGISQKKIFITGNTIVDAVYQNLEIAQKKVNPLKQFKLEQGKYFLITAHRPSNVDSKDNLNNLLRGFEKVHKQFGLPMIFPIHPRTDKMLKSFGLKLPEGLKLIPPVGFLDFLILEKNARMILTDSGGIQEEACIMGIPCITMRDNTERPETLEIGANILAGNAPDKIFDSVAKMSNVKPNWKNPFGDGKASEKILEAISNED